MFTAMAVAALVVLPITHLERSSEVASQQYFIKNDGQWQSEAQYLARCAGVDLWITDDGLTLDFQASNGIQKKGHVVKMRFDGIRPGTAVGTHPLSARTNYLIGERSAWTTDTDAYSEAWVRGVADGVDARYYFDRGAPRYDLVLQPGAHPNNLRMRIEGASNVRVGSDGLLRYDTSLGTVTERGLFAYQKASSGVREVAVNPVVNADRSVSYRVGAYDPTKPLVIDPIIHPPVNLGAIGNGTVSSATGTPDGGSLVVGSTTTSAFPTTAGAYDTAFNGPRSGFVSRLSLTGSVAWTTYFGSNLEIKDVAVDSQGRPVIGGIAYADTVAATSGAFDTSYNGMEDGFAAKLSSTGDDLLWSTYVGGANHDGFLSLTLDQSDVVYLGGYTNGGFPATPGAYDTTFFGDVYRDAAILKLSADGSTVFAGTYIGREEPDTVHTIALDSLNNVYVGGQCDDADFPRSRSGVFDPIYGGPTEGFVCKFSNDLTQLVWCTMVGGKNDDAVTSIAIDPNDIIAVGGWTESLEGFAGVAGTLGGEDDAFLLRLNTNGLAASGLPAGRMFGGNFDDRITAVGFDPSGAVVAVGYTDSTTGIDSIATIDAPHTTRTSGEVRGTFDGFVVRMSPDTTSVQFGSLFGTAGSDVATAAVFRTTGVTSFSSRLSGGTMDVLRTEVVLASDDPSAPRMSDFSLSASNVVGTPGAIGQVTGSVTLDGPATSDTFVAISSANSAATVPASITIPAGETTAVFVIETAGVTSATSGNLSASLGLQTINSALTVNPVGITLTLDAASLVGHPERTLGGTLELSQAVNHDVTVDLTSSSTLVSVPSIVVVSLGETSTGFAVTSNQAVAASVNGIQIRGALGGTNSDAFLDILAPDVASISVSPVSIKGGEIADVTVTFNSPVPSDGQALPKTLVFASGPNAGQPVSESIAFFPGNMVAPAGATTFTCAVQAQNTGQDYEVMMVIGPTASNAFTIVKTGTSAISKVTFNIASGTGPRTVTGKVTLKSIAPPEGVQLTVWTAAEGVVLSPTTFTVANTTVGSFSMSVPIVTVDTPIQVEASAGPGDIPVNGTFTIMAPRISGVVVTNGGAAPGQIATLRVNLTGKAPAGGFQIAIADDGSGALSFPYGTTVRVLEGYASGTLKVLVNSTAVPGTVVPCTATLSPYPPTPFSILVLSG